MAKKRGLQSVSGNRLEMAVEWLAGLGVPVEKAEEVWSPEFAGIDSDAVAFKLLALSCDPQIGPERACAMLQASLRKDCGFYGPGRNVDITGKLDADTVAAANTAVLEHGQEHVLKVYILRVERFYRSLELKDAKRVWRKRIWKVYEPEAESAESAAEAEQGEAADE